MGFTLMERMKSTTRIRITGGVQTAFIGTSNTLTEMSQSIEKTGQQSGAATATPNMAKGQRLTTYPFIQETPMMTEVESLDLGTSGPHKIPALT